MASETSRLRKSVLLVDDSATTLMMQRMILRSEPWELIVAREGREAIDLAASRKPDLILLDIVMPGMSGADVRTELRRHEATRSTPIVKATTRGDGRCIDAAFRAGCSDYITKPIDGRELLHKVRAAFRCDSRRNPTTEVR